MLCYAPWLFYSDTGMPYDALGKRHGGTKAGKAAKEKHKDLMKRGMLGYQHDCVYCKAAECACPSHARKK